MIFIDTGAFLARYLARDQYHNVARRGWKSLRERKIRCFTSNFVLDETITLLARRAGYSFAFERAQSFYDSYVLEILRPQLHDELEGLTLFKKYGDQQVSFTDCISFVLMRNNKIKSAFTFDQHFAIAGFEVFRPNK
jgi:predicted nucleic acid-binding protein